MRSSTESERTISRNTLIRFSSKNMCSVRTRPMPFAPNLRARAASRGLSALARTWNPVTNFSTSARKSSMPDSSGSGSMSSALPMYMDGAP